jgi:hypothetical protein
MQVQKFVGDIPNAFDDFKAPTFPKDRRLQHITKQQYAMTTENIGWLLNHAVSLMDPGEVYVEVGTYKGGSLSYAMDGNRDKDFFAYDNFTWFTKSAPWWRPWSDPEPQRTLKKVLRRYSDYHVRFQEGDFRKHLPTLDRTIGVYFYDGHHSFQDQYDGLNLAVGKMAEESLIIVDDTNPGYEGSEARIADEKWLSEHPDWALLFDLQSPKPCHSGWWSGIQIIGRRRK